MAAVRVAREVLRPIHCVRTQEMLRFWLQDGGELRHSSRPGWPPTPTLRIAVCRGRDEHHEAGRIRTMAACCPAGRWILAAAAAADHPGNTAPARDSGAHRVGALRSPRAGRDRR